MSVGNRIKYIRNLFELSVKDFAGKLSGLKGIKVDRGNLSRYENDLIKPSFDFFYSMYKTYGINLNWLITGEGSIFVKNKESRGTIHKKLMDKIS